LQDETEFPSAVAAQGLRLNANTCPQRTAGASRPSAGQEGYPVIQETGKLLLVIASPAKAATTAAAPVASSAPMGAAAAETRALRTGFVHGERPSFHGLAVEPLNSGLHIGVVSQFEETKTSGFTRHLVTDNHRGNCLNPSVSDEFR
jgi:hypothetical protein